MKKHAVISFSGGMDSSSLLFTMLAQGYEKIHCFGFDYGQRHSVELKKSRELIDFLNENGFEVEYQLINVRDVFSDSQSALGANKAVDVPENEYNTENLKVTVVENRNVIFSSIIYAKALSISKKYNVDVDIALGVHNGDNCFTKATKFLTPNGIKRLDEISVGDSIYSVNKSNGLIESDTISDIVSVGHNNKIIRISTTAGVLELTDEHKVYHMVLENFNRDTGYDKFISYKMARDVKPGDFLFQPSNLPVVNNDDSAIDLLPILEKIKEKHGAEFDIRENCGKLWIGRDCLERLSIPRIVDAGDFMELMAWYITEGNSRASGFSGDNSNGSKYRAEFCQSISANTEKVDRIIELLKRLESPIKIQFSKSGVNGMPKEAVFYASNVTSVFMKDCGSNAYNKIVPDWMMHILRTNAVARDQFIEAMILADGYSKFGCEGFCSVSNNLIESMRELLWLSGYYTVEESSKVRSTRYLTIRKVGRKRSMMVGDLKATRVLSVDVIEGEEQPVFDITVEKNHNFFAGVEGLALISNSTYPDCRPASTEMAKELYRISNYGSERINYVTPFIHITKTDVLKAGLEALVELDLPIEAYYYTSSCYNPTEADGIVLACGKCATCLDRLKAFKVNGLEDPIAYKEQ